jgi:hypothetical protein
MAENKPDSTGSVSRETLDERDEVELALAKERRKDAPMSTAGCLLRGVVLTVLLTLITCGGGYVGVQWWIARYVVQRDAVLASIRSVGDPITAEEMAEFAATPKEPNELTARFLAILRDRQENGAWTQADSAIPIVGGPGTFPPKGEHWALEGVVKTYLSKRPWLDDLESLAEAEGDIRIPRDYGKDTESHYDRINLIRELMRELKVRFHVRMRDGDRTGALRTLRALYMLPRVLAQEPELGSQAARVGYHMVNVNTACEFLKNGQATADEIAAIRPLLNEDFPAMLVPTLKGERASGLITLSSADMSQFSEIVGKDSGMPTLPSKTKITDLRPGDTAVLLEKLSELIQIAEENDLLETLKQFKRYEDQIKQMTEDEKLSLPWNRHVLVSKFLPQYLWTAPILARALAQQSALKAALDVEEKLLPLGPGGRTKEAELAAIQEFLPVDPFTGEPMKYLVGDLEYRIYSVGDNGIDDTASGTKLYLDFGVTIERTVPKSGK